MGESIYFLIAIGIAVLFAVYLSVTQVPPLEAERELGRVSYVIDGDTLILKGVKNKIRLWGVDAPEKGEQGSFKATLALEKLTNGKKVSYIKIDTDKYNRIVARVFLSDGREINKLLIEQGVAKEYCRYSKGYYGYC